MSGKKKKKEETTKTLLKSDNICMGEKKTRYHKKKINNLKNYINAAALILMK